MVSDRRRSWSRLSARNRRATRPSTFVITRRERLSLTLNNYMQRHTSSQTVKTERVGSCEARDLPPHSQHESVDPSPGVIANSGSPNAGIPLPDHQLADLRGFVAERSLQRLVMDDRARSRRAAAAVLHRFAQRSGLRVFRMGRTRLYLVDEFFDALARDSRTRMDALLHRARRDGIV